MPLPISNSHLRFNIKAIHVKSRCVHTLLLRDNKKTKRGRCAWFSRFGSSFVYRCGPDDSVGNKGAGALYLYVQIDRRKNPSAQYVFVQAAMSSKERSASMH